MRFRYSQEHLDFLRAGYKKMPIKKLVPVFNKRFKLKKNEGQIKSALANHKILCGRPYGKRFSNPQRLLTPEQDSFLREKYLNHTLTEIVKMVKEAFGISLTYQQLKTYTGNHDIKSGRTGQFEKGHINWNKGTRGLCKPNSGSFQKGQKPANVRPLGSERICSKDGYVLIKVAEWDHNFNRPTKWKAKHIHIWEQENGPVKPGYCIKFKDGDKLNIDPSNLVEVSQALNLRLNKHGYNDAPAELKPSILALAKLEVETFRKIKGERL